MWYRFARPLVAPATAPAARGGVSSEEDAQHVEVARSRRRGSRRRRGRGRRAARSCRSGAAMMSSTSARGASASDDLHALAEHPCTRLRHRACASPSPLLSRRALASAGSARRLTGAPRSVQLGDGGQPHAERPLRAAAAAARHRRRAAAAGVDVLRDPSLLPAARRRRRVARVGLLQLSSAVVEQVREQLARDASPRRTARSAAPPAGRPASGCRRRRSRPSSGRRTPRCRDESSKPRRDARGAARAAREAASGYAWRIVGASWMD